MPKISVCYPVWKFAHCADPYLASMKAITSGGYDPDYEAALIQSVFDVAHAARHREEAENSPLDPVSFPELREEVERLAVCHG